MHMESVERWQHDHAFVGREPARAERRTRWVVALTLGMMVAEIVAGTLFRSMALLADGWHMGTHAAALSVAAFAYAYARKHAADPRYTFGTGKVGALGGFASAVGLAVIALLVLTESAVRLASPVTIRFDEAILVACVGLAVNLFCAFLLRDEEHGHAHGTDHLDAHDGREDHDHDHVHRGHGHRDHNLRAAYLHVLADAMTSVLAIVALLAGRTLGWSWMDPVMGIVGSVVIARWSYGLLRDTSSVLLDAEASAARRAEIRGALEQGGDRVADLHVWRVGPRHLGAIVSVVSDAPRPPAAYKQRLAAFPDLVHVTVEVHRCDGSETRGVA
ncbi:CDF family Co(II)/Ni(II) efflux transporter DmeF [Anaeromyxobacter sp. Fw109-5]|uniref:CDF family Co(II)/Ni(II) efflux transporter DmeF n=1 Tax=Anaeromyxobacter sp. (strain Fw109-5) TaxID=404589 RepID=UPI0000ED8BB5|nr:CDF family Co(II)/Ni(II) efflux transporter DmeF [Anaeromyxobacter sp. Fw109-5]ABS26235.1 cation diffusion facilitator family transporter [Anaeromyxobacter sp. Fw109-5]